MQGSIDDFLQNRLPIPARQSLPDVSQWSLSRERYVQYLVNQQAVHHALESSVAEALAVNQGKSPLPPARCHCSLPTMQTQLRITMVAVGCDTADGPSRR